MRLLDREEFMKRKTSDTLAIMGCGWSINEMTAKQWYTIHSEYNQFGMNWYCNDVRDTTFYMIREQCVSPKKLEEGSTIEDLYCKIGIIDTTLIIKDNHGKADDYFHVEHLDEYDQDGIVVKDIGGKCGADCFNEDIFESGLRHGKCSMWDALHFAVFMGYKEIIFFGVDLYDTRYFWLPKNETREIVSNEGKTNEMPHNQIDNTVEIVKSMKKYYPEIKLMVQNPKSVLAEHMEVWGI